MIFLKVLLIICSYLFMADIADICAKGQMLAILRICYSTDEEGGVAEDLESAWKALENKAKRLRHTIIMKIADIIELYYIDKMGS